MSIDLKYFNQRIEEKRGSKSQSIAHEGEIFMFNIREERLEAMQGANEQFKLDFRFTEVAYDVYGKELGKGYYGVYAKFEGYRKYDPAMLPRNPAPFNLDGRID